MINNFTIYYLFICIQLLYNTYKVLFIIYHTLICESTFYSISKTYKTTASLYRGVINGKAGKAAALPKFSDMLTPSQPEGAYNAHPLALLA